MTASASAGDAAPAGGAPPPPRRLVLAVSSPPDPAELEIARAFADSGLFEVRLAEAGDRPPGPALPATERLYRALDRRLYGGRGAPAAAPAVEPGGPAAAVAAFAPAAVVDLTGALGAAAVPVLTPRLEGRPARALEEAVRARLGVAHGTVRFRVTEGGAGGRELFQGACCLDHRSLVRSVAWVARKLPAMVQGSLARREAGPAAAVARAAGAAGEPALTPLAQLRRLAASVAGRLLWRDQWRILVYRDGRPAPGARPWALLQPDAGAFWADPFLAPGTDGVTVLFEELPFAANKGRISAIELDAEGQAGPPAVVLECPWHLSYPFLLEEGGRRFMIPESSANRTVDLYEAERFPGGWRHVQTLLSGLRLADATVIRWGGRLWMFAAHGQAGTSNYDELHLYSAEALLGPWHPHPLNPVKLDAGSARPAGAMWIEDGRIVRPVQDCRSRYGDRVAFQVVTALDETRFAEAPLDRPDPGGAAPGEAVHTWNEAGRWAVIDAARRSRRR